MKEDFEYRFFKYNYTSYCQGTADKNTEYALLYVPTNSTFNNTRSTLINKRHNSNYVIDIDSVKDLTIHW